MQDNSPKFRREPAEMRKVALIEATLSLIAEKGVRAATVRAIAERAEVTPGLIRHHFSSKEDLITAAYEHHMRRMTEMSFDAGGGVHASCRARLAAFVGASLSPPVVDPGAVSLWAGFLNKVQQDARMQVIHEKTYRDFRDRLEGLIGDALTRRGLRPRHGTCAVWRLPAMPSSTGCGWRAVRCRARSPRGSCRQSA